MKPLIYIAHPVSGDAIANAQRAIRWTEFFVETDPGRIYIAPWVPEVLAFGKRNVPPSFYQRVLDDDCEVIGHCNGLVGVGGKWSGGMLQERAAAKARGLSVLDLTRFTEPTPESITQFVLDELWMDLQVPYGALPKAPY